MRLVASILQQGLKGEELRISPVVHNGILRRVFYRISHVSGEPIFYLFDMYARLEGRSGSKERKPRLE